MSKIEVNAIEPQSGTTLTLGASGDTVALAAGATATGFSRTGTVNWSSTIQTTGFTAVSGNGYFCDTTSAAFTVTLPASPASGDIVAFKDYAKTWDTNNLTIGRNSSNIEGEASNAVQNIEGQSITLIYVNSTKGWVVIDSGLASDVILPKYVTATGGTVLTCGNYKTHVFTSSGCFVVSCAGNSGGSNSVEYLVIAGGGSGGSSNPSSNAAAGGGAGGYRQNYPSPVTAGLPVTATTYPITVGGGATSNPTGGKGNSGSNSIFSTITSAGGGAGAGTYVAATSGGSGGGGMTNGPNPAAITAGSGNTPPVSPPQGNSGGNGAPAGFNGSGGGIGAAGTTSVAGPAAAGGIGSPMSPTFFGPTAPSYGTPGPAPGRYFAGGGGAGAQGYSGATPTGGTGGSGGGGAGGNYTGPAGNPGTGGTTNTGGGGGGASNQDSTGAITGGAGGSGIVVIRYKYQ